MSIKQPVDVDDSKLNQRQRRMRRVQFVMGIFAACFGLASFSSVAGNARFEAYHTLDVIRLMTAGAGLGVALVLLIHFFKFRSFSSDDKKE